MATSKKDQQSLLRVGDTVMLYFNAEKRSQEEAINSGYIISDLSVTNNHSLILFPSELVNPNLPNIQFGTFKVLAENKYEAQARLNQKIRNYEATEKLKGFGRCYHNVEQLSEENALGQIAKAKKDAKLELNENQEKQKRLNGAPIFYGDNIQLQHTLTKKYLATSTSETSRTERTKLKASLEEEEGRCCIFKILPRYKIHSVGDEVRYSDQVKFESVATEGQFLHCSKKTFGDVKIKANKKCHEINLASTDSALTIIRHYQPNTAKKTDCVALKGGGTVRLLHKQQESYVVANGSFAGVFASLREIRRVHEMHPDFRISATQHSLDDTTLQTTELNRRSQTGTHTGKKERSSDPRTVIQVQADIEPGAPASGFTHEPVVMDWEAVQEVRPANAVQDRLLRGTLPEQHGGLDGSVTEDLESRGVVDEDVHFEKNSAKKLSANTLWQVEKLSDQKSGEPISWSEKCRIKHLPTRMYLAVSAIGSQFSTTLVSKTNSDTDSSSVFVILPVAHQDSDTVYHESLCRIKHYATDTWLHFNKDLPYYLKQQSQSAHVLREESDGDSTELFQLCATKELFHNDCFVFEEVKDEFVTYFNYMAGITTVLTNQIRECRLISSWNESPHHMHHHCNSLHTMDALTDLLEFLDEPRDPCRGMAMQELMCNLKVVELIVYMVELHRDDTANDPKICTPCFAAISKYLEGNSSRNKRSITVMADILFSATVWNTKLKDGQSVETMLINMTENSPSLLMGHFGFVCQVTKQLVDKLVQEHDEEVVRKNHHFQGPKLLEALSVLCECNGVPIIRNQDQIYASLREVFQDGKVIFYSMEVMVASSPATETRRVSHRQDQVIKIEMEHIPTGERVPLMNESLPEVEVIGLHRGGDRETWKYVRFRKGNHFVSSTMPTDSFESEYIKSQLNLFVKLCLGDNRRVIEALMSRITSEESESIGIRVTFELIMSALNSRLHTQLKALYVELLQAMFVDVGKNRPFLDQLPFSFKLGEVTKTPFADTVGGSSDDKGDITALTKVENKHFPHIKQWIDGYFMSRKPQAAEGKITENLLLSRILQLLSTLIKYGYYDDPDDIHKPLEEVFKILEEKQIKEHDKSSEGPRPKRRLRKPNEPDRERNTAISRRQHYRDHGAQETKDLSSKKNPKSRHEDHQDHHNSIAIHKSFFKVKKCAMEALELLFNYEFYRVLHLFIYDYKLISSAKSGAELKTIAQLKDSPNTWNHEFSYFRVKKKEVKKKELACNHARFVKATRRRLREFLSVSGLHLNKNSKFPDIMLELAQYDDKDLLQHSLQMLDKFYTLETSLLSSATHTELLVTDRSVKLYNEIERQLLSSLREFLDRKNMMGGLHHTGLSPLQKLCRWCWLDEVEESGEAHHQNQKIIYNFGIMSSVVDFIQHHAGKADSAYQLTLNQHNTVTSSVEVRSKAIIIQCFQFLRALAYDYREVQIRLLQHVDLFLSAATGDVAPHVGRLLREVYSGGPASALRVNESQIKAFMAMIFLKDSASGNATSMEGKAEFVRLLQELVVVRELSLPVKHNQNLVAKVFNNMRDDDRYWCKELLREGKMDERLKLLKRDTDSIEQLQILLMVTDLLASCAEGDNANTESVCCTVFMMEEVLHVVTDPQIKLYRKRPFVRFLVSAYLNAGQRSNSCKAIKLSDNRKLWKFMDNSATLLMKVCGKITKISTEKYLLCKNYIMLQAWKYSHSLQIIQHSKRGHQTGISGVSGINGPTSEDIVPMPDALLYLAEGFLPFLHAFYTKHFDLSSYSHSDQKRSISEKICETLLKFNVPFNSDKVYFSMEIQVKMYRRVMFVFRKIFSGENLDVKDEFPYMPIFGFEDLEKVTGGRMNDVVETEARREYCRYYRDEIELNKHFNTFVLNYQLAYQGPNTLKAQIGAGLKRFAQIPYSEVMNTKMTTPRHAMFPLGPAFQEHVARFMKPTNLRSLHSGLSAEGTVKPLAEQLLKQLEISSHKSVQNLSEAAARRQVSLDIKCLQILRCMIHNHIVQIDPELKERDPEKYRRQCSTKLHPVQISIQNFGNALSRVLALLSNASEEVVYEILAFLNVLLESCHCDVQKGLKDVVKCKEHPMFATIQKILKEATTAFTESQCLANSMKMQISRDESIGLSWGVKILMREKQQKLKHRKAGSGRALSRKSSLEDIAVKYPPGSTHIHSASRVQQNTRTTYHSSTIGRVSRRRREHVPYDKMSASDSEKQQRRISFMSVYQHTNEIPGLDSAASGVIYFHDFSHIELILKVLGFMCDGQYKDMQNFLRSQNEQIQSVDLVGEVTSFLQTFYQSQFIDRSTLKLLHRMLQTLIEMSVGNHANQKVIFNRQILPVINHILQLNITNITSSPEDTAVNTKERSNGEQLALLKKNREVISAETYKELRKQALELKGSAIELLEGMLEETSLETKDLVTRLSGGLDVDALHGSMVDFYKLMLDKELIEDEYDDNAERGLYRTYHILVQLKYYGVPEKVVKPQPESEVYRIWEQCRRNSKSVEVIYQSSEQEILTRVHFKFDANNLFREELINRVKLQIKRNSPKDKLRDFLEWMAVVKKDTKHHKKLRERKFTLRPLISFNVERYYILLFLTLLMNLLILVNFEVPIIQTSETANSSADFFVDNASSSADNAGNTNSSASSSDSNSSSVDVLFFLRPIYPDLIYSWFSNYLLYIFGGMHLFFSLWMMLEYFLINWPNFVLPNVVYTNFLVSTLRKALKKSMTSLKNRSNSRSTTLSARLYRLIEKPGSSYGDVNILGVTTLYVIIFFSSSALSLYLSGYLYCVCLFYIVVNNDILQRALQSITKNAKTLLWVAAFILTFLFIYSILSFAFFYQGFNNDDEDDVFCQTLAQCFATVLHFGLLDELGLNVPLFPRSPKVAGVRLIFDISIFIIVTVIGLNIVLGIIVDTFSELRHEKYEAEQDMKSVCFICGRPCYQFEKVPGHGFKEHVKQHHNMWSYIYYSLYLDQIDTSDHNAIEKYIHEKIQERYIDYFPMNRALVLDNTVSEEELRIIELKNMIKTITDKFGSLQDLTSM